LRIEKGGKYSYHMKIKKNKKLSSKNTWSIHYNCNIHYKTIILSVVLYGWETWSTFRGRIQTKDI
jgi:hypothetical protein